MDPIPPISPTQNYYSHLISSDQPLPPKLAEQLKDVVTPLQQIHKETQYAHPNTLNLTADFEHLEHASASFLTEVSHNPNRGYEKEIKDRFESLHNTFLDDLSEIKQGEEALRDVLYDTKKVHSFLDGSSRDNLAALGQSAHHFADGITATFKLH